MLRREEMLKGRLDEVRRAINGTGPRIGSPESIALIRLEDELSASLVELRDKISMLREASSTVLYAPRTGRLVELHAVIGAEVSPEHALATITSDTPEYRARVYLPSELASRLAPGTLARIRFGAEAGKHIQRVGRVVTISTLPIAPRDVDRSVLIKEPMYEVDIAFSRNQDTRDQIPRAAPSMPVSVGFELDQQTLLSSMFARFSSQ